MNDLFNVSPPPVAVNNDIVEVRFRVSGGPEQVAIGRVAQCLAALASRGQRGVTSAEFAAGTRVSDSIHKLRHRHVLGIETERVGHGGIYSGEHAIYRVSSSIEIVDLVRADAMRARRRKPSAENRHAACARAALPARPTTPDETATDRGYLIGILKLAQAAGDTFHIRAMRLVLKNFDDRARAARRRRRGRA